MDVEFRINAGTYKGKVYRFTLSSQRGVKQWSVTPLFRPAPHMVKERIDMAIAVRETNIPSSGAVELKAVNKLIQQLSHIAEQTDVTLVGFDKQERPVQIDQEGFNISSTINEPNKEPEYMVSLTCWGLYGG